MELARIDGSVARIIQAAFPEYRGRKVRIQAQEYPLNVKSSWDGGSRDYFVFVNLSTLERAAMPAQSAFDRQIEGADKVMLPENIACVEHSIFCGKDVGITIHVNPVNMPLFLSAPKAELTDDQKLVLVYTRGRKASYVGKDRCQMAQDDMEMSHRIDPSKPKPITREAWETAKAECFAKGLLNKAGAITADGKNAIENERY